MKAFKDKETGMWKWGARGEAIYNTKEEAQRAGLDIMTERLRVIRNKLYDVLLNHGK